MKQRDKFAAADPNDELIRKAFALYDQRNAVEIRARCLESAPSLPEYSADFRKKAERLFRTAKRPALFRKRAFKAAVIVAAVLALLAMFVFGVTGIRERLFGLFLDERPHASFVLCSDGNELRDMIETRYSPEYVPAGYVKLEDESQDTKRSRQLCFELNRDSDPEDALNRRIVFRQSVKSARISVDTENADVRYIKVRNTEAAYVYKSTDGYYLHYLTWVEDGYIMTVALTSTGDYEMMLSIAESVRPET